MHISPIETDADHEAALRKIEALWGVGEGSEPGERLNMLVTLVEDYKRRRWPIKSPSPTIPHTA